MTNEIFRKIASIHLGGGASYLIKEKGEWVLKPLTVENFYFEINSCDYRDMKLVFNTIESSMETVEEKRLWNDIFSTIETYTLNEDDKWEDVTAGYPYFQIEDESGNNASFQLFSTIDDQTDDYHFPKGIYRIICDSDSDPKATHFDIYLNCIALGLFMYSQTDEVYNEYIIPYTEAYELLAIQSDPLVEIK